MMTSQPITSVEGDNDRNDEIEIYCFLSPSARYGVYITRTEVPDFRPLETHFYNYHFTVSDFILDTAIEYTSTCGPFKRFHRFYFLNDIIGILVDFSRNNGNVTQNVIQFSHVNHSVTCKHARIWNFNVDDMLYETDITNMVGTTALMKYKNITYLPLLGERDYTSKIYARLVPANPFHSCNFIIPMLIINDKDAYRRIIQTDNVESNLCTDTRCYPFINETSLYFIIQYRSEDFNIYRQTCIAMLKIDFKNYFTNNFSPTAEIDTTILPLRWISSGVAKKYIRPRFVKIMAQNEHIALLRAFITAPERIWILINLNTMTMNPLEFQSIAKHNCAMLDKNRLIFHLHENVTLFNYNIIWGYYMVPKLKHLAFWKAIITIKKYRSKECWQFHLTFHKFCIICSTLEIITRLFHSYSDNI
ncbi:Target of rapamycin [Dirofilaria immitis]